MYELEIFDSIEELWRFLIKKWITDYSFTVYEFEFMNTIKNNFFLSYKK